MNPQCFARFAQPLSLQRIGRDRLTSLLLPFAGELLAHGILLPAATLPDEAFFFVLATLPRRHAELSGALREAMSAIELMDPAAPDAMPPAQPPWVVSEIRLRLADRARPLLLTPAGADHGVLDAGGLLIRSNEGRPALPAPGAQGPDPSRPPTPAVAGESPAAAAGPEAGPRPAIPPAPACAEPARPKIPPRYQFSRKGHVYVVRYGGLPKFHMPVTDGTRYLDLVLHRENESLRAAELERLLKPHKAAARPANSTQRALDARALRELRRELLELAGELAEAESAGRAEAAARLEAQMAQVKKSLLSGAHLDGDSGERARNNVRKAIGRSIARLRRGDAAEQAFGRHLAGSLSLGYEVMYVQPLGKIWSGRTPAWQ